MQKVFLFLFLWAIGLLQVGALNCLQVAQVKPDLLLVCVILFGLTLELPLAFFLSIIAGMFKDAFGIHPFGIQTLLFGLWVVIIRQLKRRIAIEDIFLRTALVFTITLIHHSIVGFSLFYSGIQIPLGIFLRIIFLESIYTVVSLPLLLTLVRPLYALNQPAHSSL